MDIRSLDIRLLVSLEALLTECSVTRAARALQISQPALSGQLAQLRRAFDDALLVPSETGRQLLRTARAEELLEPLRQLLRQVDALVNERGGFDPATATRVFRVAATDSTTLIYGLPLINAAMRLGHAGLRLAFSTPEAHRMAEQLERGDIDLVLGTRRLLTPGLKCRTLGRERFVMVQRRGHPRGTGPLTLDAYCAGTHLLVSTSGTDFQGQVDRALAQLGRARHVAMTVSQISLVPDIVAGTDFFCTLAERVAMHYGSSLEAADLPFELDGYEQIAAWHPRNQDDPGHRWLRGLLPRESRLNDAA